MALSPEDRLEIYELLARRAHASDYPDVDAWVDTFTPDGVLEMPEGVTLDLPGGANDMERFSRGAHELRGFLDSHLPDMVGLRHWLNNIITEGDGKDAKAVCMFNLIDTGNKTESVVSGRYTNTLKKTPQGWKSTYLKVELDPSR
jgi:hypothetical protein